MRDLNALFEEFLEENHLVAITNPFTGKVIYVDRDGGKKLWRPSPPVEPPELQEFDDV